MIRRQVEVTAIPAILMCVGVKHAAYPSGGRAPVGGVLLLERVLDPALDFEHGGGSVAALDLCAPVQMKLVPLVANQRQDIQGHARCGCKAREEDAESEYRCGTSEQSREVNAASVRPGRMMRRVCTGLPVR